MPSGNNTSKPVKANTAQNARSGKSSRKQVSGKGNIRQNVRAPASKEITRAARGKTPVRTANTHSVYKVSVDKAGRILVPAKLREAFSINPGQRVTLSVKGEAIELRSGAESIRKAQAILKKRIPPDVNLADELILERRADAERE